MSVLRKDVCDVSEHDFPRSSPIEAQLGFLLRCAILAPSTRRRWGWAALLATLCLLLPPQLTACYIRFSLR